MKNLKSLAYPVLQRSRYAKFIFLFEKSKSAPMQSESVLMFATSKGKLGGNLLAIKNYIEQNNMPFNITAITSENRPDDKTLAMLMAQSRFIIVDDYEPLVYVLKLREGQHLIQVWHAMGAFKRFGYGRQSAEKNSLTHKNYTEAICSSPEVAPIYAEAFGISQDKIIPVGSPRTDLFFDKAYVDSTRERLYTKEPRLRGKKICLFAPTFRGENVNDACYPKEFFDVEAFANSLGEDWAVIIKMHPFVKEQMVIPDSVSHRVFDFGDEREINDILFITDVLVTDYSSVIFENAIIGNAAVLYTPDLADYDNGRGFYYDYSAYACGEVVSSFDSLSGAVLCATADNEKMLEFKNRFVSLCDGKSSERFVNEVLE